MNNLIENAKKLTIEEQHVFVSMVETFQLLGKVFNLDNETILEICNDQFKELSNNNSNPENATSLMLTNLRATMKTMSNQIPTKTNFTHRRWIV